jgi:hypothetical protein
MRKAWLFCLLVPWLLAGCFTQPPVDRLPDVAETLDAVGKRLSHTLSESRLTTLATDGGNLLPLLRASERDALGRGYLRFHSRQTVVVEVAAPEKSVPFWVHDLGFVPTGATIANADGRWLLFRKEHAAGWNGLGVNGLDRSPRAHYVVFLRSPAAEPPLVQDAITLGSESAEHWRKVSARPGVSAAQELHRPFAQIPTELDGAILLQPFHDRRHSALLANARVWKSRVPSSNKPDQVTIAYGGDPAHELVWSWRTAPTVQETAIRILPAS